MIQAPKPFVVTPDVLDAQVTLMALCWRGLDDRIDEILALGAHPMGLLEVGSCTPVAVALACMQPAVLAKLMTVGGIMHDGMIPNPLAFTSGPQASVTGLPDIRAITRGEMIDRAAHLVWHRDDLALAQQMIRQGHEQALRDSGSMFSSDIVRGNRSTSLIQSFLDGLDAMRSGLAYPSGVQAEEGPNGRTVH